MTRGARLPGVAAAGTLAGAALVAANAPLGNDYPLGAPGVDAAGPQIDALIHGDLDRFFAAQSFLGPVSLVLRALFALPSRLGDAALLTQYRLGVFACLAALGLATIAVTIPV